MLTAQLKCNPLYHIPWQNDRNITNKKGRGPQGNWLKIQGSFSFPPSSEPAQSRLQKASICEIIGCPGEGYGAKHGYKKKKLLLSGLPDVSMETL